MYLSPYSVFTGYIPIRSRYIPDKYQDVLLPIGAKNAVHLLYCSAAGTNRLKLHSLMTSLHDVRMYLMPGLMDV